MKKLMTALALCLLLAIGGTGLADSEGVIVQSACNIMQSGEYYLVYCFAQVHNNSDQVICLEQGAFELHNGEQLLATEEVSSLWPYFINPGEDGFLFDIVTFEPQDGVPVVPNVTAINYNVVYMTVDQAHAGYDLSAVSEIELDEATGSVTVRCELTNTTDMDAFDPTVAIGLYTEEGSMIYADGVTLKGVGIPAGGTTLVRFTVEEAFVSQWQGYGVAPTQAYINASFRLDED